jgi:hypothetical protein
MLLKCLLKYISGRFVRVEAKKCKIRYGIELLEILAGSAP